jgi:hypothetical protein
MLVPMYQNRAIVALVNDREFQQAIAVRVKRGGCALGRVR